MGGAQSQIPENSPLDCLLHNLESLKLLPALKPHKLKRLCNQVWPHYSLDNESTWPLHGTLDPNILRDLHNFCKRSGKQKELPYVAAFSILRSKPSLCSSCSPAQVLLASEPSFDLAENPLSCGSQVRAAPPAQAEMALSSTPSPAAPPYHSKARAAPPPTSTPAAPSHRSKARAPPPPTSTPAASLPSALAAPSRTKARAAPPPPPTPAPPAAPPHPAPAEVAPPSTSAPAAPPPLSASAPALVTLTTVSHTPDSDLGGAPAQEPTPAPLPTAAQHSALLLPLREVEDAEGSIKANMCFSLTDLSQIAERLGSFTSDPSTYIKQFKCLMSSYDVTWDDIHKILTDTLLPEERQEVWAKACTYADEIHLLTAAHPLGIVAVPEKDPLWDYNSQAGRQHRDHFIICIFEGLKQAAHKAVNYDKMARVFQDKNENPSAFWTRLNEALIQFTDLDPESIPGQCILMTHFMNQAAPDIRAKLKQLDKGALTPRAQALEVACKVYHGREDKARRLKYQMPAKIRQPQVLQPTPSRRRPPRFFYRCGQKGHGKGSRPQKEKRKVCKPCYRCGQHDHRGAACPQPKKPTRPCPRCHERGHWAVDCPSSSRGQPSTKSPSPSFNLPGLATEDLGGPGCPTSTTHIITPESRVTITVAGRPVSFLVETGAMYSVLPEFWGQTFLAETSIEVEGKSYKPQQTPPVTCLLSKSVFCHSFLVIPHVPSPLLGRDLLTKFDASITSCPSQLCERDDKSAASTISSLVALVDPPGDSSGFPFPPSEVDPLVWDTHNPSTAKNHAPVHISLRGDPQHVLWRPQYSLPRRILLGLQPIVKDLLRKGLLRPVTSPYNSPIFAATKPNGSFRLIQDLHLINAAVEPLHLPPSLVPNPNTLLCTIPSTVTFYSVVDIKDACFTIPLSPSSQDLFAFTWTDPITQTSTQLTWTVLPQGFRDSQKLFSQALAQDLEDLDLHPSTLIQYVDDLLLCSPTKQLCHTHTVALLNFLASRGYRVSPSKVQAIQQSVTYLGVELTPTHKAITTARKNLIADYPVPTTKAKLLSFLGVANYLRSWIPNYSLLTRPLYEASKRPKEKPFLSPSSLSSSFKRVQQALLQAPALRLPDLSRPFLLYVTENQGFALGVLGQQVESSFAPVAYLSKRLSPTVKGWAPCLRTLDAASVLIQESKKLTFGAALIILSHHHLSELLTHKGLQTKSPSRLLSLQGSLRQDSTLTFQPCPPLNPSTLLPIPHTGALPPHACVDVLENLMPSPRPH
ncbi:uncharacterized protein [Dipodomys merriami]|uniref:uncharacterized protein n=1 Tax=Dipodomys merriami TaxID=94247 RepID=UPI0038558DFB